MAQTVATPSTLPLSLPTTDVTTVGARLASSELATSGGVPLALALRRALLVHAQAAAAFLPKLAAMSARRASAGMRR